MERRDFGRGLLGFAIGTATRSIAQRQDSVATTSALVRTADELNWLAPGRITDVPGIKVGHFTSKQRPTGCTVILAETGAVAGVEVRGSAPGTRETDLLNPLNIVQRVQAIVLAGGSAYGLDTAAGVTRYLEEHGLGFKVGRLGVVPIVPAAILFDLGVGDPKIRPNAEFGYLACVAANSGTVTQGNVGAGAGATIGKMFGAQFAMKSGVGTASTKIGNTGVVVGAIVAVNAVGDILHPKTGKIIAGARRSDGPGLRDSMAAVMRGDVVSPVWENTSIGVVATNAALEKVQVSKIAQMAHDGLARTINPAHTLADGDTIFALATGTVKTKADHGLIGAVAAEVIAQAVIRAVVEAEALPGLPSYHSINETRSR